MTWGHLASRLIRSPRIPPLYSGYLSITEPVRPGTIKLAARDAHFVLAARLETIQDKAPKQAIVLEKGEVKDEVEPPPKPLQDLVFISKYHRFEQDFAVTPDEFSTSTPPLPRSEMFVSLLGLTFSRTNLDERYHLRTG